MGRRGQGRNLSFPGSTREWRCDVWVVMEKQSGLFEETPVDDGNQRREGGSGKPRVEEPQRGQGEMRFEYPEDALEQSHPARVIWDVLGKLDLRAFSIGCESVEG